MKIGKVEKDIPIPLKYRKTPSYGFHLMEIGDSKYIALDDGDSYKEARSTISTIASVLGIQLEMKFRVKRDGDGLRVWRIE